MDLTVWYRMMSVNSRSRKLKTVFLEYVRLAQMVEKKIYLICLFIYSKTLGELCLFHIFNDRNTAFCVLRKYIAP